MRIIASVFVMAVFAVGAAAQIQVNPTGVNINSQNATTVFLTFGPIPPGYVPAEAIWCGELVPSLPPAIGLQCRPDTIYGSLPARLNRSTVSGSGGFTDIMGIPPSIVRRAYQAAVAGNSAGFFYVRRFVSTTGGPDQFVNVTCRMTGGGARVPFALTDVRIKAPEGEPVLFIKEGEAFPKITAEIQYNGTGRLKGRWEIVQPGEDPPADRDLLTEATLPIEQRGTQRRYTQVARFSHFLMPTGKFSLPLELSEKFPTLASGQYVLLLRVEATDDKESDSNLAAIGVGPGTVHSGAVASFPMPSLKFFVTGVSANAQWEKNAPVLPMADRPADPTALVFTWRSLADARFYKLEVFDGTDLLHSAITVDPMSSYAAPPWLKERAVSGRLTWTVSALDADGNPLAKTAERYFQFK